MEAVRRRLFNALTLLSLLLFVAVCSLWVRSYWVADAFALVTERQAFELAAHYGDFKISCVTSPDDFPHRVTRGLQHRDEPVGSDTLDDAPWYVRLGIFCSEGYGSLH